MITNSERERFKAQAHQLTVLVVGDLMLDRYLWGKVNRISPEAPVPIVEVEKSESRPGGAANVALNLGALGAKVILAGVKGEDSEGELLTSLLAQQGFDTQAVLSSPDRATTTKTRVIGNWQQMIRVDREKRDPLPETLQAQLAEQILERLPSTDVLIFEDYDKGVLSPNLIQQVIQACQERKIPTVVDPKFRNFFAYGGATLFKPNLKELNEGLGLRLENRDLQGIKSAIQSLRERMPHIHTLITLSENGVYALDQEAQAHHIPAHYRQITDVSGAGDTVVAMMGLGLGVGISVQAASAIANLAGGLVCEEVGVVPVSKEHLFKELDAL